MKISKILCATLVGCAVSNSVFASNAELEFLKVIKSQIENFNGGSSSWVPFAPSNTSSITDEINDGVDGSRRQMISKFFEGILTEATKPEVFATLSKPKTFTFANETADGKSIKLTIGKNNNTKDAKAQITIESIDSKGTKKTLKIYKGYSGILGYGDTWSDLKPSFLNKNMPTLVSALDSAISELEKPASSDTDTSSETGAVTDSGSSTAIPAPISPVSPVVSSPNADSGSTLIPVPSQPSTNAVAIEFVKGLKADLNAFLDTPNAFDGIDKQSKWSPINSSNQALNDILKNTINKMRNITDSDLRAKIFDHPIKITDFNGKGFYLVVLNDGKNIGFVNSDDPMATVKDPAATDDKTIIEIGNGGNAENTYSPYKSDVEVLKKLKDVFADNSAKIKLNEALDTLIKELDPSYVAPVIPNDKTPEPPVSEGSAAPGVTLNPSAPESGNGESVVPKPAPTIPVQPENKPEPVTQEDSIINEIDIAANTSPIYKAISTLTKQEKREFIASFTKSMNEQSLVANRGTDNDILQFSSSLATKTRLAKLSNPYNDDILLARAIKELKNDQFASNDNNNAVSSVIKEYTSRFNYQNNFWGSLMGAKGSSSNIDVKLYGATLGFDKTYDNVIAGGFLTYANSKAEGSLVKSESENLIFGLYARYYYDNHEFDAKFSLGGSENKTERNVKLQNALLSNNARYESMIASLDADYGYVIKLEESLFIKPLVGFSYSYSNNKGYKETGDQPMIVGDRNSNLLSIRAGLDIRKYVTDGGFIYINPGIEQEVQKSIDDSLVRFFESGKDIKFASKNKKQTFFTVQTGADIQLTDHFSTNINFGSKLSKNEKYYNGTIGLKYKF